MNNITPRARVMRALRGEPVDKVPFTAYECFVKHCTAERVLRERGMCVVYRTRSYKITYPDVKMTSFTYQSPKGETLTRTDYETPVGHLSRLQRAAENTSWILEYPFKSPDNYKALQFIAANARVEQNYDAVAGLEDTLGEDFIVRDGLPLEPLQGLISGSWMDPQDFALEWYDNRDELLVLYESAVKLNRQCYELIAGGPFAFANYGGNVVPQIIGPAVFREYYMPHYEEAADCLHRAGKLIGCHYDADNTPIMEDIAATPLDYIEAYDPMCSPEVDVALRHFKDKALWLNWPSAWHLLPSEQIIENTRKLLRQAEGHPRFLIGITEDVPTDRWQRVFSEIMDGIDRGV